MKKIAYLISVYTEPMTFRKLIESLNEDYVDFYVHIDKKVSSESFKSGVKDIKNVFFVPDRDRIEVHWGGYSQVQAQYKMIELMFISGIKYCRIVNLSGTDYPIISNRNIYTAFTDINKEYIIGFDVNNEVRTRLSKSKYRHSEKFSRIYLMDANIIIRKIFFKLRLKRLFDIRKLGFNLYFGSEYWALTYECLREIISIWRREDKLRSILKTSYVPSEAWIHSCFFLSSYAHKAVSPMINCYERGLIELSPLSFFKYDDSIKILDEKDFDEILDSNKCFARKVVVGKSDRLIGMIDKIRNV